MATATAITAIVATMMATARAAITAATRQSAAKTLLVLFGLVVLGGLAAGASARDDGPVNAYCPVLPEEPVDLDHVVEVRGIKVGLCCRMCRGDFLADPEGYLAQIPELAEGGAPLARLDEQATAPATADADHSPVLEFAGRLHVLFVHFPIALILAALLAELLGRRAGGRLDGARFFCLVLGAAGAAVAATLGWLRAETQALPASLAETLFWHRWLGVLTAVLALLATWLARPSAPSRTSPMLRGSLLAAGISVAFAGHYGAQLVYGLDFLF